MWVAASARSDVVHDRLVIPVTPYSALAPPWAPYCHCHNDREELLNCNRQRLCACRPLDLEPLGVPVSPTSPRTRDIRYDFDGDRPVIWPYRDPIPLCDKLTPPLKVCTKAAVEANKVWVPVSKQVGRLSVLATVSTRMPRTVISVAGPSTLCTEMGTPNSLHAVRAVSSAHAHSLDFGGPHTMKSSI